MRVFFVDFCGVCVCVWNFVVCRFMCVVCGLVFVFWVWCVDECCVCAEM